MPKFECDLPADEIIDPLKINEIVSSKSYRGGNWWKAAKHKLFNEPEVKKIYIPLDGSYWDLDLITIVDAGTIIPRHSHTEPVLRYVLDGSFELNGVEYEEGDWIIVPANYNYQIQTREGYKVLSRYHADCKTCSWRMLSKMPLQKIQS